MSTFGSVFIWILDRLLTRFQRPEVPQGQFRLLLGIRNCESKSFFWTNLT